MHQRSFRAASLPVILLVSFFAVSAVHALDGTSGTLATVAYQQISANELAALQKECWLLAHNQDMTLVLLPADYVIPPGLASVLQTLEPLSADGGYYIYWLENPALAAFTGETRVLLRGEHTVLVWSTQTPPQLTPESKAAQHGLIQPARVTVSPKVWPATASRPDERTDFHPLIAEMVADVSQSEYVAVWQALDDYETRYSYTTQNDASAVWMHDLFESYGLQAEYHTFQMSGTRKNVIGILPGLVDPSRVVYLTGHFDSTSEDPNNHAPGADDNASGTAMFLEAARVLSQYAFQYTIKFVGFSGEEQGLVGSAAYVDYIASQGEDVVACFNCDMISYAGTDPAPPDLIIYTNSASLSYAQLVRDACLEYVPQGVEPVIVEEAISASDHASFWDHGYKAILGIEEEAWGADFCPWYHTVNDRIEQYPQDYPTNVTRAVIASAAQTAIPMQPDTPYLLLDAVLVDDDNSGASHGNGNGVLEYGETIELRLTLRNIGQQAATGVLGQLQTSDAYIALIVANVSFGNIPSGGTATNATPFVFTVSPDVPDDHTIAFQVALNQPPNLLDFELSAFAPDLAVVAYDVSDIAGGDGDGIPEPGETVALDITITNQGSVGASDVWGTLAGGAYLQADPTPCSFGTLNPGQSSSGGPFSVEINPSAPPLFTSTLRLTLEDSGAYSRTAVFGFNIGDVFSNDMEDGAGGWTHYVGAGGYSDQWHLETYRNHTYGGTTSWKCGGNGSADYANLMYAVLESSPFILPESSTLSLWHWIEAEISQSHAGYCYDGGLVEISIDGGPWQGIAPQGGYPYLIRTGGTPGPFPAETPVFSGSHGWVQETFDLAGFSGSARLRFVFGSDGADAMEGWYIDDVQLALQYSGVADAQTHLLALHPAGANLGASGAELTLDLPQAAQADVRVFDASGRQVRVLFAGPLAAGSHPLRWDGCSQGGAPVGSGVYWVRAEVDQADRALRLVVVR